MLNPDLDDVDRDLLARALLEAARATTAGRCLEFRDRDVPALLELRERVRPAYSRERRITTGELTR